MKNLLTNVTFLIYGILFSTLDLPMVRLAASFLTIAALLGLAHEYGKYIARGEHA